MNTDCLHDWIKAKFPAHSVVIGPWADDAKSMAKSFVSLNFEGGRRPGPASRYSVIDVYFASKGNEGAASGGKKRAMEDAQALEDFFAEAPNRPFSNVVLIAGIIGQGVAEGGRLVYKLTIEITT